ncbi:hypothetical protein MTO96_002197 [Rhipicephalus appendiculatus]
MRPQRRRHRGEGRDVPGRTDGDQQLREVLGATWSLYEGIRTATRALPEAPSRTRARPRPLRGATLEVVACRGQLPVDSPAVGRRQRRTRVGTPGHVDVSALLERLFGQAPTAPNAPWLRTCGSRRRPAHRGRQGGLRDAGTVAGRRH